MIEMNPETSEGRAQEHKVFFDRLPMITGVRPLPGLGYVPRDDFSSSEDTFQRDEAIAAADKEQPGDAVGEIEEEAEQLFLDDIQVLMWGSQQRSQITLLECLRQHIRERLPDDLVLSTEQIRAFYAESDNTDRYRIVRHLACFLYVAAQKARVENRESQVAGALLRKWEQFQQNLGILRPNSPYVRTALEHAFQDVVECLEVGHGSPHDSSHKNLPIVKRGAQMPRWIEGDR